MSRTASTASGKSHAPIDRPSAAERPFRGGSTQWHHRNLLATRWFRSSRSPIAMIQAAYMRNSNGAAVPGRFDRAINRCVTVQREMCP